MFFLLLALATLASGETPAGYEHPRTIGPRPSWFPKADTGLKVKPKIVGAVDLEQKYLANQAQQRVHALALAELQTLLDQKGQQGMEAISAEKRQARDMLVRSLIPRTFSSSVAPSFSSTETLDQPHPLFDSNTGPRFSSRALHGYMGRNESPSSATLFAKLESVLTQFDRRQDLLEKTVADLNSKLDSQAKQEKIHITQAQEETLRMILAAIGGSQHSGSKFAPTSEIKGFSRENPRAHRDPTLTQLIERESASPKQYQPSARFREHRHHKRQQVSEDLSDPLTSAALLELQDLVEENDKETQEAVPALMYQRPGPTGDEIEASVSSFNLNNLPTQLELGSHKRIKRKLSRAARTAVDLEENDSQHLHHRHNRRKHHKHHYHSKRRVGGLRVAKSHASSSSADACCDDDANQSPKEAE